MLFCVLYLVTLLEINHNLIDRRFKFKSNID
jgi:hypothetical protein